MLTDKQKIDEITLEMTKIENLLTGEQDEFLELLDEFIGLYDELRGLNNDNTRDIAIRCVDEIFGDIVGRDRLFPTDDEFKIQDIIHNEINKALKIKEDR
tara:strand:+ start:237 stop:536 length:300 start_codon:yes stop_codon:yes gene_type:complete